MESQTSNLMIKPKVLILSNNENVRLLSEKISGRCDLSLYSDAIDPDLIKCTEPDLVISYNYKHIVKEDVIDLLGDRIINLHCSLLPWNKGASPNIWSFIDDTPKGVTVHRLEKGLDTGKLILQKEVFFDEEKETLESSYNILQETITGLLSDNLDMISSGKYKMKEQPEGGSYHKTSDLKKIIGDNSIDYSMTIKQFRDYISSLSSSCT